MNELHKELNKALNGEIKANSKYAGLIKAGLESPEGQLEIARHAQDTAIKFESNKDDKNKALSAIRNALARVCKEQDVPKLTVKHMSAKVAQKVAIAAVEAEEGKAWALTPATKQEKPKDDRFADVQVAFNEWKKDVNELTHANLLAAIDEVQSEVMAELMQEAA